MYSWGRFSKLTSVSVLLTVIFLSACGLAEQADDLERLKQVEAEADKMINNLLDQAATMSVEDYDPAVVIQTVNALQPLGKAETMNRIDSYLSTHDDEPENYGLFWVLRVLFDLGSGQDFPPVKIGRPSIEPPTNPDDLPRFPIVVVQEIPILVVSGYDLGGVPESVEDHVEFFRKNGVIRAEALSPGNSIEGVKEEFIELWRAAYGDSYPIEGVELANAQLSQYLNS